MIVLEFKVKGKPHQYLAVDEAIRTVQFVRNKCLRLWMDGDKVGQKELYLYTTRLRKEFPFVEKLNSTACQQACERARTAIARFYDNCKKQVKGKKGYPRFQKNNRSVEYKQSGWKLSDDRRRIEFTDKKGIGTFKLVGGWDLNFYPVEEIKRVRLLKRADGYYCQFVLSVDARQYTQPLEPAKRCIGLDVGLKVFYADSDGKTVEIPRFYRKAEKRLNRLDRKKSKKFRKGQKQSNNYIKARKRYARQHLKVSRKRKGFAVREALRVIQSNDLVAYEELNVKGLVRSNLAKSINDAAWSTFRQWLEYFGYKYGKVTVAVPPYNTSQNCSNCGEKVPKSLSTRTHICSHCGYIEDRDVNAAVNILKCGLSTLGHTGSKAWGDLPSSLVGEILLGYGRSVNQESSSL